MATPKWKELFSFLVANYKNEFTKEMIEKDYGKISAQTWKALITHECVLESDSGFIINTEIDTDCGSAWTLEHQINFSVNYKGTIRSGIGINFTEVDLPFINDYYFKWKEMNETASVYGFRRINLPEILSEGLTCAVVKDWIRTNNSTINGCPSSGDAFDVVTGDIIQIKGVSSLANAKIGPTSFGPNSYWDVLVCVHVDCTNDVATFYRINEDYHTFKVNKDETVEDQQKAGRRPRLNLMDKITELNIKPFMTYNFVKEN